MTTIQHRRERQAAGTHLSAVLGRARAALRARREADVALLVAAVEWAETHPAPSVDEVAGWGEGDLFGEGFLPLAGEGAPLVAEFAPYELAASLDWSTEPAKALMGDGLELKHRLPQLWRLVLDLDVPVSVARLASEQTRDLGPEAAAYADRLLTRAPRGLTARRVKDLVDEARLYHDPDRALDDEQHALASRKVEIRPGNTPATADIQMVLDTADAIAFERAVARGAEALGALGDDDPLDVRRARAVGVLADPQRALDLFAGHEPSSTKGSATLFLHLDESHLLDIDTHPAAVRAEGLGVLSSDLLAMWLAGTTLVVKPVLHLDRRDAVDRHDPPDWMADLVRLRDPTCVFPGCHRRSRACDLDHIEPYVPIELGGPPGQTRPDNLAPLCRGHHRAKTHGDWHYRRLPDGSCRWTSPAGLTYLVLPPPPPPRP